LENNLGAKRLPDENKLYTCRTTFYGLKKPKSVVLQLILLKKKFWEPKKCWEEDFRTKNVWK
jgi:hypothetical protein